MKSVKILIKTGSIRAQEIQDVVSVNLKFPHQKQKKTSEIIIKNNNNASKF